MIRGRGRPTDDKKPIKKRQTAGTRLAKETSTYLHSSSGDGQTSAGHATNPEKRARTSSQRMYHGGVEAPFRSSAGRGFCWQRAIGTSALGLTG